MSCCRLAIMCASKVSGVTLALIQTLKQRDCAVFVHEQGFDLADEIDDYDPVARHFALIVTESDAKKLVGTIRVVPEKGKVSSSRAPTQLPLKQCQVGRLAILKQYRSFGFGNDLVQAVKKWAIEERAKSSAIPNELVLHSQVGLRVMVEQDRCSAGPAALRHPFLRKEWIPEDRRSLRRGWRCVR